MLRGFCRRMRLFFENVDSSFGECRRDNESWHISLLYPSTLFPYSFLHSFAAVTELWCSWFFGSRVWVLKNGGFSSFLRGTLESILQRRGLAYFDISKWPAVQINANRWFFRFRSRMTDISGDVCALHQYALYDSAGVFSRSCCLRLPVSFDTREGPPSSREGCCRCLGLLRMPLQGRFALGGLLNKWGRGWREEGVLNVWPAFDGSMRVG